METQLYEELDMEPKSAFQKWMFERGIKQAWLSSESGLKQPLISKIATRKTKPDVFQARHILNALRKVNPNITLDDLWPMEEDE